MSTLPPLPRCLRPIASLKPLEQIVAEIWRDDKVTSLTVPLFMSDYLCPIHFSGRPPSYFVLGGLVFTVMSEPYLEVIGWLWRVSGCRCWCWCR